MYFGTEARLLKAEGSQEAMAEVKGASSVGCQGCGDQRQGGKKIQ